MCVASGALVLNALVWGTSWWPFRKLHEAGLCITVNSDDPPYFGGYVNKNYAAIQAALGFTDEDLWQMARNSFTGAYMSNELRTRYLSELDGYRPKSKIP